MTDKALIKQRFSRAAHTYHSQAAAQREIALNLARILAAFDPKTEGRVLEIGCGTGFLTLELRRRWNPKFLAVNDLSDKMLMQLADAEADMKIEGDAETVPFPSHLDLIASCSTVQWFENPAGFFDKCADSLSQGGLLAVSSFGERNMQEIALLTSSALQYRSTDDIASMLQRRFDVLHMSQTCFHTVFASPRQVLNHLKDTGVTGTGGSPWTRRKLTEFEERYRTEFPCEGGVRLTYNPIYFIARKK